MFQVLQDIYSIIFGESHNVKSYANDFSNIGEERIREMFNKLEKEGVVRNVFGDYYVSCNLDSKKERLYLR